MQPEADQGRGHKDMRPEPVEGSVSSRSTSSEHLSTSSEHQSTSSEHQSTSSGHNERIAATGDTYRTRLFTAPGVGTGDAGRRSRALTSTGRTVGATRAAGNNGRLHL